MRALWDVLSNLLDLLPGVARKFLVRYAVSSSVLSLLDIVALSVLALVLGRVATGTPVVLPVVGELSETGTLVVLLLACGLMVLKSLIALLQQWYVARRMAQFELEIGDQLFNAYIRAPWLERMKRNS